MLGNLAFTLYEIFGYLVPGCVTLLGLIVVYWSLFVSALPLNVAAYRPGTVTWVAVVFASYLLGHAVQGITNPFWSRIEYEALSSGRSGTLWLAPRAAELAAKLASISAEQLTPVIEPRPNEKAMDRKAVAGIRKANNHKARWTFRILDEYGIQTGKAGDRDVFVYREGFYRATSVALFFLSLALVLRAFVPGTAIYLTRGIFHASVAQILLTALVCSAVGRFFVNRYRRFADYRVTRAVLAALVLDQLPPKP